MAAPSVKIIFATVHASWPLYFVTQKVIEVYLFIFLPFLLFLLLYQSYPNIKIYYLIVSENSLVGWFWLSVFHDIEVIQSFCLSNLLPELFIWLMVVSYWLLSEPDVHLYCYKTKTFRSGIEAWGPCYPGTPELKTSLGKTARLYLY